MALKTLPAWRHCGAAVVLLGGLSLALLPAEEDAKPPALPADLAKIPSDGMLLASVRLADLWTGDFLKSVRGKYREDMTKAAREFDNRFGFPLEQVERLTFVIVGPPPASREPVFIVRTVKPYKLDRVLAADARLKPEKYKGETLYVSGNKWAVYPLDDRTLVYSEFPSELRNLIDHPRPKEKDGLADAVERAAEKHLIVFGVNIKQYSDSSKGSFLPPDAEPFRPLFAARWATLVADAGKEFRLETTLHFANEKDAGAALKTARSGLDLLRSGLDRGIRALDRDKDSVDLVTILKQFQTPLKEAQVEQKDQSLHASVRAKVGQAALGVVLVQGVQKGREAASRSHSANNLKQFGLAMHLYHDEQKRFPPQAIYDKKGKPLLSWRVLLLPYIGEGDLYKKFHLDEPWDSEHNKKLLAEMPRLYASPHDEKTLQEHTTYYQGFTGKGAFFEGKQGNRLADFTDGVSQTIMLVEAAKAVPWTKPEDIPYDPAKPLPRLGLPDAGSFLTVLCDGSVRLISKQISKDTLRGLITRNGEEVLGSDFE